MELEHIIHNYFYTKRNIEEFSTIKSNFIMFLKENKFEGYLNSKHTDYRHSDTNLTVSIKNSLIEEAEAIVLRAFDNEWNCTFQSDEVEKLEKVISIILKNENTKID